MSRFTQALDSYRNGELTRDELLAEVDRQLTADSADTATLLTVLNDEQSKGVLPGNIHIEIVRKLLRWRGTASLETQARAVHQAVGQLVDDDAATVFIDDARSGIRGAPRRREFARLEKRPILVGSVLQGRFRLIERIGDGGMSTVYKAIDQRKVEARANEPHVAVKILTVPADDFTHSVALLQSEAHKLQTLPHPNIVRVIDCDRDGATVFMTMEYLNGESLKRKLSESNVAGMPAKEAVRIVECLSNGLAFAHRNGIIHGDLKPGNVLITDRGEVKIIDFGIARLMKRTSEAALGGGAQPTLKALTPSYASPEMLTNGEPDPRDDVYALACIAYELLTGQHPFDRRAANEARDAGLEPVRRSPISHAQFRAIAQGLAFEREKRTPSAEQFVQEFSAKRGLRTDSVATAVGAGVIAVLIAAYFLDHGRIVRWLESHRGLTPPAQGEVFRDCPTCPLMKVLPPGQLEQGAAPDQPDITPFELPRHHVAIAYPLGIGVYEVTVGEFKQFVDATAHQSAGCTTYDGTWQSKSALSWNNVGYRQTAGHPVVCVSWQDARDYANWLSRKTGQRYRLPSDSEWEYAARAGSEAFRTWGTRLEAACLSANVADQTAEKRYPGWKVHPCADGYVYSAPVGSFQPNAFGLYDMLGNAFEWVQDCWHADYRGAPTNGSAWLGGDCTQRDMRGGSWFTVPSLVSVTARNHFEDSYRSNSVGFRLVREVQ
jgi:formylglycine-generating enzyme required for sulfatase activity/predicted Ser/Thr protein kinase